MKSIQYQLTVGILSIVVIVVMTLSLLLFNDFRKGAFQVEELSNSILNQSLADHANYQASSIAVSLSHNLVNPVYQLDMLQIQELILTTLKQSDVSAVTIYDANNQVLHDGSELNNNYGSLKKNIKEHKANSREKIFFNQEVNILSADAPIWLFDEFIGSVVVRIDLSRFESKKNLLSEAITAKSQNVMNRSTVILVVTIIVFITLALMVAIYFGRRLSTPIVELAKHAEKIGVNQKFPLLKVSRRDEIGLLQRAINRMGKDIVESTVSINYLENLMDSLNEGLLLLDMNLDIQMSNRSACTLLETTSGMLEHRSILQFIPFSGHKSVIEWLKKINNEDFLPIEIEILSIAGRKCMVSISASILTDDNHGERIICLMQDITERKLNESKILFLAQYDSLTHLPNRALFNDRLGHAMGNAERNDSLLALFFIDIDFFKKINDSLGHSAGDELLIQIAMRLRECVRETDTVSRLGGDEFTVILELIKSVEEAEKIAVNIVNQLSIPFDIAGQRVHSSLSLGVVYYPFGDTSADALIKKADVAMYHAKQKGRNTLCVYDHVYAGYQKDQLYLENELRNAVKSDGLELFYQPKVNIKKDIITSVEALLRWEHPTKGSISCLVLIPLLEELGLMGKVGDWVLMEACKQAKNWQTVADISVAVNVTAEQFCDVEFIRKLEVVLQKTQLDPHNLIIEITETSLIANIEISNKHIRQMQRMGVSLAIDDFGTGYSSLAYLKTFDLQSLKIDKAFVDPLPDDTNSLAICEAIVAMSKALNVQVVAEGVETREQYEVLKDLEVDEIQGFYFAHPMSADDLLLELENYPVIAWKL